MNWEDELELRKAERKRLEERKYAALREQARREKEGWGYQIQSVDGVRNPNFSSRTQSPLSKYTGHTGDTRGVGSASPTYPYDGRYEHHSPTNEMITFPRWYRSYPGQGSLNPSMNDSPVGLMDTSNREMAYQAKPEHRQAKPISSTIPNLQPWRAKRDIGNEYASSLFSGRPSMTNANTGGINYGQSPMHLGNKPMDRLSGKLHTTAPTQKSIWDNVPDMPTPDAFSAGEYVLDNYAQPVQNFFGGALQGMSTAYDDVSDEVGTFYNNMSNYRSTAAKGEKAREHIKSYKMKDLKKRFPGKTDWWYERKYESENGLWSKVMSIFD